MIALIGAVLSMSMVSMMFMYLLPAGRLKNTAMLGMRVVFLATVAEKIIGIFAGWGV